MAKIICVDFDGVIHSYTSGWLGADVIPDPPVPGAFECLFALTEAGFQVCIYSSRSKVEVGDYRFNGASAETTERSGIVAMRAWFASHGMGDMIDELRFPTQKPAAMMTVDDRAFCFEGDFPSPGWIERFKPWNKRG